MQKIFDPVENYKRTKESIGYVDRDAATGKVYDDLGFRCGLEIHQQLKTEKKLFCRCPAGLYQKKGEYDAEVIRHMRPTLSELGEYDGTALMEFKTKKTIVYRIKNETACTYDIDDTPPFGLNREALAIAMEVALLLKCSIVGELHITRKQYLDGSIPTGFQRTGILGIEGEIPLKKKKVRIIQLSIEEEACREVSDVGHIRIYTTDRLGMPLIETVTYHDLHAPDEVAEVAHYLRFLTRSTGKMRTGIGAAREDVNVSINGGTRVEIKGVAHIKWLPELTHNEAFRQKALLEIRKILTRRISDPSRWKIESKRILASDLKHDETFMKKAGADSRHIVAVNLPEFKGILSFFTQPGMNFANELSSRLKVIACLDQPNMTHSETHDPLLNEKDWSTLKKLLKSGENDAHVIFWGPEEDMRTALETIDERCCLAFDGVPNETRKALKNGTTIFERILPGPDRMYPDTDSPPIPIKETFIEKTQKGLPSDVSYRLEQMKDWGIPSDTYTYILKRNLFPIIEKIITDFQENPSFVGTFIGHTLKNVERRLGPSPRFQNSKIYNLFSFIHKNQLNRNIVKLMLPIIYLNPDSEHKAILKTIGYQPMTEQKILSKIPLLKETFKDIQGTQDGKAKMSWIMGKLRPFAIGNMDLREVRRAIDGEKQ